MTFNIKAHIVEYYKVCFKLGVRKTAARLEREWYLAGRLSLGRVQFRPALSLGGSA
ncbi:hypothetical protein KIS4809_0902 [Bacillus sp. ZZV12-4809]|nr:hypothetical protein KIS4809_0902 [Bacillus sp. ZZV12-4809]